MPQPRHWHGLLRGALYLAMGLVLLATAAPPRPVITFQADVQVPDAVLDDAAPRQRVVMRFAARNDDAPRRAELLVQFEAEHSDPAPQHRPDNTPWVTATVIAHALGAAGALAPITPAQSAPFLAEGTLPPTGSVQLDPQGRAELTLELERAPTAEPIRTRVRWTTVRLTAQLFSDDDDNRPLPWDIDVVAESLP